MIRWLIFNIIKAFNIAYFYTLDIIYQIPQILYSSIVLAIINLILKSLSLSEKKILVLKKQNNIINALNIQKQYNCV